jgi:hypothetical protein
MTTILVVDDSQQNIYQLQVLLRSDGYQVVTAGDGAEALSTARQDPPDLIVTDGLMPVMDGFTLCRECQQDERLKAIPLHQIPTRIQGDFRHGYDRNEHDSRFPPRLLRGRGGCWRRRLGGSSRHFARCPSSVRRAAGGLPHRARPHPPLRHGLVL